MTKEKSNIKETKCLPESDLRTVMEAITICMSNVKSKIETISLKMSTFLGSAVSFFSIQAV